MNLIDVARQFDTEEKCLAYLEKLRWPGGVCCIKCGSLNVKKLNVRAKSGKTRKRGKTRWLYQCLERPCLYQFTATAGTIFHKSHLPLSAWFIAIALICEAKKGISANQLKRHLGVNYRTAWFLNHRIREAMQEEGFLTGEVEIDETYLGPKKPRKGRPRTKRSEKVIVIGMRERKGRLRLVKARNVKATEIRRIVEANVSPDVKTIFTDEHALYVFALPHTYSGKHKTICHKASYAIGTTHIQSIENAFSLFRRGLSGVFHNVSLKHLERYLREFSYRFNRRDEQENLFGETLTRMLNGRSLNYADLTASSSE